MHHTRWQYLDRNSFDTICINLYHYNPSLVSINMNVNLHTQYFACLFWYIYIYFLYIIKTCYSFEIYFNYIIKIIPLRNRDWYSSVRSSLFIAFCAAKSCPSCWIWFLKKPISSWEALAITINTCNVPIENDMSHISDLLQTVF